MPRRRGYRTQHCRFYVQGRCRYGDECSYIHDPIFQRQGHALSDPTNTSGEVRDTEMALSYFEDVFERRKKKPCFAWRRGTCTRGDRCWYGHDEAVQRPNPRPPKERLSSPGQMWGVYPPGYASTSSATAADTRALSGNPLRSRAVLAACERIKAALAREGHETQVHERQTQLQVATPEQERQRQSECETHELQVETTVCAARQRAVVAEHMAREQQRILEQRERIRVADQMRRDATVTTQRVILGTVVTFGAGLAVQGFITGFESCAVQVRGLPADAVEREIYELFTQQGIERSQLHLSRNQLRDDNTRDVRMIMDGEAALALSVGLDSIEFRNSRLSFAVDMHNAIKNEFSCTKDPSNLDIFWPAYSSTYTAIFISRRDALSKVAQLNDTMRFGRRLKVEIDDAPSQHVVAAQYTSVRISNLPRPVSYDEVCALVRPEGMSVRALPTSGRICSDLAMRHVLAVMALCGCPEEDILPLRQQSHDIRVSAEGSCVVSTPFRNRYQAERIKTLLEALRASGDSPFRIEIPPPYSYSIVIPRQQFTAQFSQWVELRRSVLNRNHCRLVYVHEADNLNVRLRISGTSEKAVGAMKVRVEHLVAGEVVDGWHSRLNHGAFAGRIRDRTGTHLYATSSQYQIRVCGAAGAVALARTVISDELARLAGVEVTKHVPPNSVQFISTRGLPVLYDLLGRENVRLDLMEGTLTAPGSEESQHIVDSILEQASVAITVLPLDDQSTCPVCYDIVSSPVTLGCGHVYCAACLQHFLVGAIRSDNFPLVCMGNEAQCGTPVALPSIMQFLSPHSFARLLEVVFRTYISQHPQELRYCRTPDCRQVCRVVQQNGPRPVPAQCPACLDVVCPGCNEDVHEGSTCAENRARNSTEEQERLVEEWIMGQGGRVKKCPQCGVPVEKTAGCNHIACRCGAHICWRCMGTFEAREIYGHMTAAHGSFYAEPAEDPFVGIDPAEQENLLRRAGQGRGEQAEDAPQVHEPGEQELEERGPRERRRAGDWCIVM